MRLSTQPLEKVSRRQTMNKSNSPNIISNGSSNSFEGNLETENPDLRITSKFAHGGGFDEDD